MYSARTISSYGQQGYGGIEMFLGAVVIGFIMYFFFYPAKFNKTVPDEKAGSSTYCRDLINDPNAPTITAPSYTSNTADSSHPRTYRLIKKDVPIVPYIWGGPGFENVASYEHLASSFKQNYIDQKTGEKFVIRIPNGSGGRSYEFQTSLDAGKPSDLKFGDYGILLLYHVDQNNEPITFKDALHLVDIYKAVDLPELPLWVTNCIDGPKAIPYTRTNKDNSFYYPNPTGSPFRAEQQLNWFLFRKDMYLPRSWWVPHCKPAIYLYPQKEQNINVQIKIPQGELLYTDPIYPKGGWNVIAKPDGSLHYLNSELADSKGTINYADGIFPYLYYEGRIADNAIEKPTKGFVKKYDELESFYDILLPKLGLNEKETKEFKEYWVKALPQSPYYFIGIVSQDNLNEIEPLTITPKQDTTIRVSLYFEALPDFKVVTAPTFSTPGRNGFTVIEWGGMVKRDKDHPFTCVE